MALLVQKYGGTSMGSAERIDHVASKVAAARERGHRIVVVVSAMSGETDRLMKLAKSINPRPNPRELDQMLATGEQVTIALLATEFAMGGEAFTRTKIPLDRPTDAGWFVTGTLKPDDYIVVTGAQTLLSEELKASLSPD